MVERVQVVAVRISVGTSAAVNVYVGVDDVSTFLSSSTNILYFYGHDS